MEKSESASLHLAEDNEQPEFNHHVFTYCDFVSCAENQLLATKEIELKEKRIFPGDLTNEDKGFWAPQPFNFSSSFRVAGEDDFGRKEPLPCFSSFWIFCVPQQVKAPFPWPDSSS